MSNAAENQPKLLLHACCGPCSTAPLRVLSERGTELAVYYANSNIHPSDEYAKRLDSIRAFSEDSGFELIEGPYDPESWEAGPGKIGRALDDDQRRQARCRACYRIRFEEAAAYAAEHGFTHLGSTLSVSPYQYTEIIEEELERAAKAAGIQAAFEDYRPLYPETVQSSKDKGMYRQNYCGCRFSDEEAELERAERKRQRAEQKAAERAARAPQEEAEKAEREKRAKEKQAYASKQARKRAILKQMREQAKLAEDGPSS